MTDHDLKAMVSLLDERDRLLKERERDLQDQKEELLAQKEELTAAIEELVEKNNSLAETLQNLQQRNNELDQILYRASHDLKTPVTSLYGLLNALRLEGLSAGQEEIHLRMNQKVDQMNSLLKSLTQLAKASFEPVVSEQFYFQEVFHEAVKQLVQHPVFTSVKISLSADSYRQIHTDRNLLLILLSCLLNNAITFRDHTRGGRISVACSVAEGKNIISVEDDGEGVDPQIAPRVFEIFFRGSERSTGAGLGLYIVQTIVKRLKGNIHMESKSGKTIFYIALPELPVN